MAKLLPTNEITFADLEERFSLHRSGDPAFFSESRQTQISVHTGVPQALTYLLARPNLDRPGYGLVTNGSEFLFLKQFGNEFATSNLFSLVNDGNELDRVLQLLRRFS